MKNWTKEGLQAEQKMEELHTKTWRATINEFGLYPDDFKDYSVLDFGCSQGAFLKHLYQRFPFKKGVGIDLASEPIEVANRRKDNLPLTYYTTEDFKAYTGKFDVVISNYVIFWIRDLVAHAKEINEILNDEGVYYFTFCDFMRSNENTIAHLKEGLDNWAETPLILHSLDEVVKTFSEADFDVEIKRLFNNNFMPLEYKNKWYSNIYAKISLQYEHTYLFRVEKTVNS